jgi:hypothetical protein
MLTSSPPVFHAFDSDWNEPANFSGTARRIPQIMPTAAAVTHNRQDALLERQEQLTRIERGSHEVRAGSGKPVATGINEGFP